MKNIGIIAEYNPFHNGHAYHIEQARKIAGGGSVIAVMSASFVQRGEPAAFDKFTRTAMALQGGADMVLELPDILSLSCAFAYFRQAALRTGCVSAVKAGISMRCAGLPIPNSPETNCHPR